MPAEPPLKGLISVQIIIHRGKLIEELRGVTALFLKKIQIVIIMY